jgi:L-rhamnose mutarotase
MNKIVVLSCLLLLMGCDCFLKYENTTITHVTTQGVRYGMLTGLKPEKLQYYKELHAKPWPAVMEKIKECNIRNYSIYLQKIEEKYFLFSYFEYVGKDFEKDMQKMAADTTTQRWWKETDPCQLPLKEALEKHQVWTGMEEVFHSY